MVPSHKQIEHSAGESPDGSGTGDHDLPFVFGRTPRVVAPFPCSTRQLGRLMVLRSRVEDGRFGLDDRAAGQP
jgi:hypothetical protein